MTHDELLAKIDNTYNGEIDSDWIYSALRAVVELHKPIETNFGWRMYKEPRNIIICNYCKTEFPCVEFQAIEKELK